MTISAKVAALAAAMLLGASGAVLAQSSGGSGMSGATTGGAAGATSDQPGALGGAGVTGGGAGGAAAGSSGAAGGADLRGGAGANVPGAGGSNSLTQPQVLRGIPGQTETSPGAAAGTGSTAAGLTESAIRSRLETEGYEVDELVRRGDVWEGRVMRNGQSQTVRIDPLTGQAVAR